MAKRIDLTGQRFGRLTVISLNEEVSKQKKKSHWNCRCDCGNEKVICGDNLKYGRQVSCGCYNSEKSSDRSRGKRIDLTGQRFGRLTVISLNEEVTRQKKRAYWNCKCDCGNEKIVLGLLLKNGHTNSCGCYGIEKSRERIKKIAEEKWKDEEFRKMMSNKTKEQWKDTEFIQKQKNGIKDKWKDNKYRQMQSDRMRGKIGENSIHWKGGITPISIYLRGLNEQWFNDCKQQANYTCELTKKVGGKLHTHHLKAFNTIVLEAHELHNIEVHEMIGEYTQEELHKLEEYVASWHKDNSNAVVLCKEVHDLFHSLYGKGDNTLEQFEEFKERYLNGEFKEILK